MENSKMRKDFPTREEILFRLKKFEKYFNDEMYDYLYALVNLDESVFSDLEFMDQFQELDDVYEIAKYNICKRLQKRLTTLDGKDSDVVDKNDILFSLLPEGAYSRYKFEYGMDDYSFKFIDASLSRKSPFTHEIKRPIITISDPSNELEKQIRDIYYNLGIYDAKDYDDVAKKANSGKIKIFSKNIVTPDQLRQVDEEELWKLKADLLRFKKLEEEKKAILGVFLKIIYDELHINEEDFKNGFVKKLSWIDIKNNRYFS